MPPQRYKLEIKNNIFGKLNFVLLVTTNKKITPTVSYMMINRAVIKIFKMSERCQKRTSSVISGILLYC